LDVYSPLLQQAALRTEIQNKAEWLRKNPHSRGALPQLLMVMACESEYQMEQLVVDCAIRHVLAVKKGLKISDELCFYFEKQLLDNLCTMTLQVLCLHLICIFGVSFRHVVLMFSFFFFVVCLLFSLLLFFFFTIHHHLQPFSFSPSSSQPSHNLFFTHLCPSPTRQSGCF
jgi:hypothetical protein